MRLNFKYIVVIGVLLGAGEALWKLSRTKRPAKNQAVATNGSLPVRARESDPALTTIPTVAVTNWSVQLGATLTSGGSSADQAVNLLAMFPNLPPEGQLEAAQHASRLLPNNLFGALGSQMTNSAAPPAVRRAVFADLTTRPNSLKLPWLVEVARAPLDGQAEEASLLLKSHLREDHGTNWVLWQERVATWLSLNPD